MNVFGPIAQPGRSKAARSDWLFTMLYLPRGTYFGMIQCCNLGKRYFIKLHINLFVLE